MEDAVASYERMRPLYICMLDKLCADADESLFTMFVCIWMNKNFNDFRDVWLSVWKLETDASQRRHILQPRFKLLTSEIFIRSDSVFCSWGFNSCSSSSAPRGGSRGQEGEKVVSACFGGGGLASFCRHGNQPAHARLPGYGGARWRGRSLVGPGALGALQVYDYLERDKETLQETCPT